MKGDIFLVPESEKGGITLVLAKVLIDQGLFPNVTDEEAKA